MAKAGDTIVLKAGTFRDSVLIDKTLTIRGTGWSKTTIMPPAASTNPCNQQGSMEGLCAVGGYGIARFVSTHSNFSVIQGNRSDHNGIGIFMRDSTGLTATSNQAWGNCVGILALNSGAGAPGDLPAGNHKITNNKVWANNLECPSGGDHPGFSGLRVALAGVHDVVVRDNRVTNNSSTQASDLPKGGIVVFSTAFLGGADPTNNTVAGNNARGNTPADIFWDGSGTGNIVTNNACMTAIPGTL